MQEVAASAEVSGCRERSTAFPVADIGTRRIVGMRIDLSFQSAAAETAFRLRKAQVQQRTGLQLESLRLCCFMLVVYRLGSPGGVLGSAASGLLLLVRNCRSLR